MKRDEGKVFFPGIMAPAIAVVVLLCFLSAVGNLTKGSAEEDRQRLEDVVRRAAVACYAAEGIYPPDLDYLQTHYGVQINGEKYVVMYEMVGSNLIPDIMVLERDI